MKLYIALVEVQVDVDLSSFFPWDGLHCICSYQKKSVNAIFIIKIKFSIQIDRAIFMLLIC